MNELRTKLINVKGAYYDFISFVLHYAKKSPKRETQVLSFLEKRPDASPSDILAFISEQPDVWEDAAHIKAG